MAQGAGLDGYLLCTAPCSGSTLLCGLLKSTGRAGAPDSYFHRASANADWAAEWGLAAPEAVGKAAFERAYLAAALRAGKGGTPLFGARQMRECLAPLMATLDRIYPGLASDSARLEAGFGRLRFLYLKREDKLAQVVSWVRAQQTGLWHAAPDGTELERLSPPAPPAYDYDRLAREIARFEAFEAAWEDWFAAEGITPLRVGYDALSADPAAELARICAVLDLPAPDPAQISPGTAKLADASSRDWMCRFREDAAARA